MFHLLWLIILNQVSLQIELLFIFECCTVMVKVASLVALKTFILTRMHCKKSA